MAIYKSIPYPYGLYFFTTTCNNWLPLIHEANGFQFVYDWFDYLKKSGHLITGFVIMPNHIHALIAFRNCGRKINTLIGEGKRFIAYKLVDRLREIGKHRLLDRLSDLVPMKEREYGKKHRVWIPSFDWKYCESERFILQKLDYMHINPCFGKWNLAASPANYPHSSARFYLTGVHAAYPVTHYMALEDVDLSKPFGSSIH